MAADWAWQDEAPPGSGDEDAPPDPQHLLDEALTRAYRHLGRRDHSVAELRTRLEGAHLDPDAIEAALATLLDQGYLDDRRYAQLTVEDRRALDGWGVERIRARLEAVGLDRDLIDDALAGIDGAAELEAATELLRRRCALPLRGDRDRQRAFAMLIGRGYEMEVAYEAIRTSSAAA